ncbi:MAG: hypothetical protein KC620_09925 [Myxococcales bacterium]|nr:hypothetical protein [Myxococcales bacterium]
MNRWLLAGAGLAAAVGASLLLAGGDDADEGFAYDVDPERPFGPYHGKRRPPGWPLLIAEARDGDQVARADGLDPAAAAAQARAWFIDRYRRPPTSMVIKPVRPASVKGAALPFVRQVAGDAGLGDNFVRTMVQLARAEGEGGTFGVPARNFDARTSERRPRSRLATTFDGQRPDDRDLITAALTFQWNRDAGRESGSLAELGVPGLGLPWDWMPWDWTPRESIEQPIAYYARLWRLVERRTGELQAARGVRLWHTGPTRFKRFYLAGADTPAWRGQATDVTARIDNHLREAGLRT